jgi:hypothetical protein
MAARGKRGHAEAPDQRADERSDQDGPGCRDEQDEAEAADRRAEGGAHRGPRGAEHAVRQPEEREAAEA